MVFIVSHFKVAICSPVIANIIRNNDGAMQNIDAVSSPQLVLHQLIPTLLLKSRLIGRGTTNIFEIKRGYGGRIRHAEKTKQ